MAPDAPAAPAVPSLTQTRRNLRTARRALLGALVGLLVLAVVVTLTPGTVGVVALGDVLREVLVGVVAAVFVWNLAAQSVDAEWRGERWERTRITVGAALLVVGMVTALGTLADEPGEAASTPWVAFAVFIALSAVFLAWVVVRNLQKRRHDQKAEKAAQQEAKAARKKRGEGNRTR